MSNFSGGSAAAMARQVAEGDARLTESLLKRLSGVELESFSVEVEGLRREAGDRPRDGDPAAIRERNLKIERLNTCRLMLTTFSRNRHS